MNSGPKISLKMTCDGCQFHSSEYYYIEDGNSVDSGYDHYCSKIFDETQTYIGGNYNTPVWCPLLPYTLTFMKEENGQYTQVSSDE